MLKNAVADNDAAAKMALGAKKQLDKATQKQRMLTLSFRGV